MPACCDNDVSSPRVKVFCWFEQRPASTDGLFASFAARWLAAPTVCSGLYKVARKTKPPLNYQ